MIPTDEQIKLLKHFGPTGLWVRDQRPLERAFISKSGQSTTVFDKLVPLISKIWDPVLPNGKTWDCDMPLLKDGIKLSSKSMPAISPRIDDIINLLDRQRKIFPAKVSGTSGRRIGILCHDMSVGDIAATLGHEGGHFGNHARSKNLTYENLQITLEGCSTNRLNLMGFPTQKHAAQIVGSIVKVNDTYCELIDDLENGRVVDISNSVVHDLRYLIASYASLPQIRRIEEGHINVEDLSRLNDYNICSFFDKIGATSNDALDCSKDFFTNLEHQL